ncbi:NADP-dependent oxidoreductase domain [Dillenia turbinata]|uniref:NADP-dependent oxidoreductase domain n=1 Tax=Dillenia turbinata TaxID=194707 RepID=A0AAN8UIW7_9MAGN
MGELKKLVEEGKINYLGFCEASPDTIRRAYIVHLVTAIQMEYSVWTLTLRKKLFHSAGTLKLRKDDETFKLFSELTCHFRELGIGLVPYSPLGRGFFGGRNIPENVPSNSVLNMHPWFQQQNLAKYMSIYAQVENLAKKHGCTPAQLALAWVLHQGQDIVPIPGTTKIKSLDDNIDPLKVKLTEEDLKEISDAVPRDEVVDAQTFNGIDQYAWQFANTPPKGKEKVKMAEEEPEFQIPMVKLGNQAFEVSKLGFGCMNLSGTYNSPLPEEDGTAVIKHAFSKGITFFDTSDMYGSNGANEILIGKALKHLPREKIQLATKFGIKEWHPPLLRVDSSPEYVRSSCEASLKRLDVEYIDLYYQHRVDTTTPIEDTMGELKKLVQEGKIRHIGLSEASPDTIRRAHAVHPITAVQMEYSLWVRDIEEEIIPLCRELGIGIVPYSPLGRGFFGGRAILDHIPSNSFLNAHPRFQQENLDKNKKIFAQVDNLAKKHGCTPAQLALAWIKNLDDNIDSLKVKLTEEDLKEISDVVPIDEVAGSRAYQGMDQFVWKFANTPPKGFYIGTTKIKNLNDNIGSTKKKLSEEELKEIFHALPVGARSNRMFLSRSWKLADTPTAKSSTMFP